MSYMALRFDAAAAEAEAWSDALLAVGALSVDISDPRAGTPDESPLYAEPGEPAFVLWPIARLTALFDVEHDALAVEFLLDRIVWIEKSGGGFIPVVDSG